MLSPPVPAPGIASTLVAIPSVGYTVDALVVSIPANKILTGHDSLSRLVVGTIPFTLALQASTITRTPLYVFIVLLGAKSSGSVTTVFIFDGMFI